MAICAPPSPEYMELESDDDNGVSQTENPSQCTSRGAKLKSNVWDHMTRDSKDSGATATCNHCKQVFSARDYNLLLSCAFVLDPRYKLDAVLYCYTKLFGEIYAKEMVAKIKGTLVDLLDEYKELVGSSIVGGSGVAVGNSAGGASSRSRKVSSKKPGDELLVFLSKKGKITSDKSELEVYLDEDNEDAALELDVLNFWKKRSAHKSPTLSALARDILSIPISSVPSESAFSLGKKMITPCRSSLRATTIEALACYEDWLRVKGFDGASMLKVGDSAPDVVENEDDTSVILTNDLHNLSISM